MTSAAAADIADRPAWTLPRMTVRPWMQRRTAHPPGIGPLDPAEWLHRDETYAAQMALRDDLVAGRPADVLAMTAEGEAPARELLETLIEELTARHGARLDGETLVRADGAAVPLSGPVMAVIARLAQEDFLILSRPEGGEEHVLVAGALCFPAGWVLAEKIGRALMRIHVPVVEYDQGLGSRVQRLHDGVKAGAPLIRANWNFHHSPQLFVQVPEAKKAEMRQARANPTDWRDAWVRVERQTLMRLPRSGAVVFGVRTLVAPLTGCGPEDWAAMHAIFAGMTPEALTNKAGRLIAAEAARRAAL